MKQAIVSILAGLQSLEQDDIRERPVDRLGAIGLAQIAIGQARHGSFLISLGRDAMAYKYAGESRYRTPAIEKIAICLGWPQYRVSLRRGERTSVAWWGLTEWVFDACRICGGKLEVPMSGIPDQTGAIPMMQCPVCQGVGKHRYSDAERERALPNVKHTAKALAICSGILHEAESLLIRNTKKMLERWN